MISRRPVRRLSVFLMQNIESELKWRTCFCTVPNKFSCSSVKGLKSSEIVQIESQRSNFFNFVQLFNLIELLYAHNVSVINIDCIEITE